MRSRARASADWRPRSVLITTGKKVRYAAITATAPQPCRFDGSLGFTQTTTIGAIARIGIVWLATMYGRKPRCSVREWTRATPSVNPIAAPSAKPAAASFAVKSALCRSTVISGGWLTWAGWPNAFAIVQTCGIDVSVTANGHVQAADVQTHR